MSENIFYLTPVGAACSAYISLIAVSGIATHMGLRAVRLSGDLDLSCVMGRAIHFEWNGTDIPLFLRQRPDAGLLQANRIVAQRQLGLSGKGLIESQSVTMGQWVEIATNGTFTAREEGGVTQVWQYPLEVETSVSTDVNATAIAVVSNELPGALEIAQLGNTSEYISVGLQSGSFDFCDVGSAGDNVWFETSEWLPFGVLRLGQAWLVLTVAWTAASCGLIAYMCNEDKARNEGEGAPAPGRGSQWAWAVLSFVLPLIAFFVLGCIGAVHFDGRHESDWRTELMSSPVAKEPVGYAYVCYWLFVVINSMLGVFLAIVGCCLILDFRESMRDQRDAGGAAIEQRSTKHPAPDEDGAGIAEGDDGEGGASVRNPMDEPYPEVLHSARNANQEDDKEEAVSLPV